MSIGGILMKCHRQIREPSKRQILIYIYILALLIRKERGLWHVVGNLIHQSEVHSKIIFLGSKFSDFAGNSRTQKLNKEQTKRANITDVHYLRAYHLVVSTYSFIFYPLFILLTHSSLFALTSIFASPPPLPHPEYDAQERVILRRPPTL